MTALNNDFTPYVDCMIIDESERAVKLHLAQYATIGRISFHITA